jgi:hypothetical protein
MATFKEMKDVQEVVEASHDGVRQADGHSRASIAAVRPTTQSQASDFEPIAGVSLALYAQISKGLAAYNYDIAKGPEVAASRGVSAEDWDTAMTGWNDRIKGSRIVAQEFNALYMGRA